MDRWSKGQSLTALSIASLILLGTVTWQAGVAPPLSVSTLIIGACGVIVVGRYDLLSAETIIYVLIAYPVLVPGIARYGLGLHNLILRGQQFQTPETIRFALWVAALAIIMYILGLRMLEGFIQTSATVSTLASFRLRPSRIFVTITACIIVGCAYFTTPGPTILTVSYNTVLDNYMPWAQFAGSVFLAASVVALVATRSFGADDWQYKLVLAAVALGVLWLLLHARRNESLGAVALVFLDLLHRQSQFSTTMISRRTFNGSAVIVAMVSVGVELLRGGELALVQNVQGATYPTFPGGAHNIWGTWLATVSTTSESHSLGKWLLIFPGNSLPSVLRPYVPIPSGAFFSTYLGTAYDSYLGGSYIFNQPFADFGALGVFVMALVLALGARIVTVGYVEHDDASLLAILGGTLIAPISRVLWYSPTAAFDIAWGIGAVLIVYTAVVMTVKATQTLSPSMELTHSPHKQVLMSATDSSWLVQKLGVFRVAWQHSTLKRLVDGARSTGQSSRTWALIGWLFQRESDATK